MLRFAFAYISIVLTGSVVIALAVDKPMDAFLLGIPLGVVATLIASAYSNKK